MKRTALTAILAIFLLTAGTAFAAGNISISSGSVEFHADGPAVLTVSGPEGFEYRQEFKAGAGAAMSLFDEDGNHLADGTYKWQITEVKAEAAEKRSGHVAQSEPASGVFTIKGGTVANPNLLEGGLNKDQVFLDDLIVDGSACIGMDCANGENFGFDTLRLKENNLRIKFDDSSATGSFPSNDWQLTANDSSNGGSNKFSLDDITNGKTPVTVEANAPSNSLFVEASGDIGVNTSTPVVEMHIVDGDSTTLRLEQNGSSGFTPQTWDIAGNETNFFIRDVTGGSKLPFRIKPGAPDDSIYINSDGNIGLGTDKPKAPLHVIDGGSVFTPLAGTAALFQNNANTTDNVFVSLMAGSDGNAQLSFGDSAGQFAGRVVYENNTGTLDLRAETQLQLNTNGVDRITVSDGTGSDLITTTSGAVLTNAGVWQSVSRRDAKTNIKPLSAEEALQAFSDLEPVTYNYKVEPDDLSVGFIAEDVPDLVATASHKTLASLDLIALLTKVVQEQQKTIEDLATRMSAIER